MSAERIRYSWGSSSLGAFLAAAPDVGLVAFEFADDRASALAGLRERFPGADIEPDEAGLRQITRELGGLADHPGHPVQLALDPRGSECRMRVWSLLREIKPGQTTNYGELARKLGTRDAREVADAVASNCLAIVVPCHRVLEKDGSISGYRSGVRRKRTLLRREAASLVPEAASFPPAPDPADGRP
jgi:AraC family transcriptional regulator, regulatory protein of adaptative response / methylated-DNA-[protein]-cysteine methyltransferase